MDELYIHKTVIELYHPQFPQTYDFPDEIHKNTKKYTLTIKNI